MKTKRALEIALLVSIALNLMAVGVFLGRQAGPRPEIQRVDPVIGMRRLLSDLPEERAQALAPLYRDYFAAMRPRFKEIRRTQRALREAMLRDPLDASGLRTALDAFQTQLTGSQQASQDAFVALAEALTLEERRQLVENMSRRPERWRQSGPEQRPPRGERPPYHHVPPDPPPQ